MLPFTDAAAAARTQADMLLHLATCISSIAKMLSMRHR